MGHIEGGGDTLQRLNHEFPHLNLDGGVGNAQGDDSVTSQPALLAEVVGVVAKEFLDDVGISVLAFRVPHLLIAAE